MKDNEIIEALKNCGGAGECQKCPLNNLGEGISLCIPHLTQNTLDLINRQKAEIKSLTEKLEVLGDPLQDAQHKKAEQQAEIARLKTRNNELNALNKTASIDAIKDFAERLKEYRLLTVADRLHIDNLVKEMVGD